jgi:hypothetical protein
MKKKGRKKEGPEEENQVRNVATHHYWGCNNLETARDSQSAR